MFLPVPSYWQAVTPSDTTDLPVSFGLYVTVAGNVAFVGDGGATVTVTVAANSYIWANVRKVLATGTTGGAGATGIFLMVR